MRWSHARGKDEFRASCARSKGDGDTHDAEDVSEELSPDGPVCRDVVCLPGQSCERGVRHAERDVVDDLPVAERLLDRALLAGVVRVVLEKVADKPLVGRLLPEQRPEPKRVEQSPRERMQEVGNQEGTAGQGGQQHRHDRVRQQEDEHKVGRPGKRDQERKRMRV